MLTLEKISYDSTGVILGLFGCLSELKLKFVAQASKVNAKFTVHYPAMLDAQDQMSRLPCDRRTDEKVTRSPFIH